MGYNSGIIGAKLIPVKDPAEADGVHNSFNQYNYRKDDIWPEVTVPTDITTDWYEISNRVINSQAYMGSTADYNGPYDVGEVQTDFVGSGRIYIGIKVTSSPTYYNDVCIAGVQVLNSGNDTLEEDYIFASSTGGSGSGWATARVQEAGSSSQGFPSAPSVWSAKTYYTITTSTGTDRFTWASSTSSSYTGCAGGVSSTYYSSLAPVGNAQISQSGSNYYAYRETSGSSANSGSVMRSPSRTFAGGEWIRVIHAVCSPNSSNQQMDPTDTLYISVY